MEKYEEIAELNKNSKLKYKLGEKNSNILKRNNATFETIQNYMSLDFYLPSRKNYSRIIKFYSFPTDEDSARLAYYYTKTSDDNVFGIGIGMDKINAEKILQNHGYKNESENYVKGLIKIKLENNETSENKIIGIEISIKTKYLVNRLY